MEELELIMNSIDFFEDNLVLHDYTTTGYWSLWNDFYHFTLKNVLKLYLHLLWFANSETAMESKDLFLLHNQYHACWCPGDPRSQGIGSHDRGLSLFSVSCSE